ncbi:MAG: YraN family protein [Deltaproteobacteria bacterium]|nr:YraN family protein [Deltaproteobacteria bacterium]
MSYDGKHLGEEGEILAAAYIEALGFRILERNYRTRLGEIDLIAGRRKAVHFIEVKTRRSHAAGSPFEQVTVHKQRQIIRVALTFCQARRLREPEMHFDVVSVDYSTAAPVIDYLMDAFEAS